MIYEIHAYVDYTQFTEDELVYLFENFKMYYSLYYDGHEYHYLASDIKSFIKDACCTVDFSKMDSFKDVLTEVLMEHEIAYQKLRRSGLRTMKTEQAFKYLTKDYLDWKKINDL